MVMGVLKIMKWGNEERNKKWLWLEIRKLLETKLNSNLKKKGMDTLEVLIVRNLGIFLW